jgi:hypothetical protein
LVEESHFENGHDAVDYFNFTFHTRDIRALWTVLVRELYDNPALGEHLTRSSIATCEGAHGWDDYLLLRHFDPEVGCDELGK